MKQEKGTASPFGDMSFQDQQDRWREWRSRQWNFRDAQSVPEEKVKEKEMPTMPKSPAQPMPTRHRELDKVLLRHQAAVKRAGAFQFTTQNDPANK